MPREKEMFREQLARLDETFPNKEFLNVQEVARYTGKDRKTLEKTMPFKKHLGISKVQLAREMVS